MADTAALSTLGRPVSDRPAVLVSALGPYSSPRGGPEARQARAQQEEGGGLGRRGQSTVKSRLWLPSERSSLSAVSPSWASPLPKGSDAATLQSSGMRSGNNKPPRCLVQRGRPQRRKSPALREQGGHAPLMVGGEKEGQPISVDAPHDRFDIER